jgi:SAM-dependent methyltransferase
MKKITRNSLRLFLKNHATEEEILDIGSGGSLYGDLFPNRLTFDIDPQKKPEVLGDVNKMPFQDNEFKAILCTEVLEHLHDPKKAIEEMKRILKPGGKLILTTRFMFPIHDAPTDYFRYTEFGLKELFKDWEIENFQPEVGSIETIAVLLQRIIFQVKFKGNKFVKGVLLILVPFFIFLQKLVTKEYADIRHDNQCKDFMTSGYYIICKNRK